MRRIGLCFVLCGIVILCPLWSLPWWGYLGLGWIGFSYLLVGIGYLAGMPGMFLKRCDGKIAWLSYALLGPFHVQQYLAFQGTIRTMQPPYQEIVPGLWLGRHLNNTEARELPVESVADLTCEFSECQYFRCLGRYLLLPTLDASPPTPSQIVEAVAFIRESIPNGVYIHCAAGHGRSATVVIAYLVVSNQAKDITEALELARAKRPGIKLRSEQLQAIEKYCM